MSKGADETLLVYLNDTRLGVLSRKRGGKLLFSYDAERSSATPLSCSMPLTKREHDDSKANPFLWNLLPDDPRLLADWGRRYQVSPSNCFALLREIGEDCAGAVRFVSPERESKLDEGGLEPISEKEIGERLSRLETDPGVARIPTDTGRFSLAGAQAKIALRYENGRWYVPWGREPTTHILKPPRSDFSGLSENEHFCLKLASELGMRTASSEVKSFAGSKAIVVRRFDRIERKGRLMRVHQEDMCQALAVHPAHKYENDGGPGVIDIMSVLSGSSQRLEDREAFMDAILLNYLILGTDAHAKNYSILHSRGEYILAPFYDIASFAPYVSIRAQERLAMRVDRYYRSQQIRKRHFERMAKNCNYPSKKLLERLDELATLLPSACERVAHSVSSDGIDQEFLEKLADRISERSKQALALP